MANTPQSKKRARQNERRFAINKARRSRVRTYLRKVRRGDRLGRQGCRCDCASRMSA